MHAEKERSRLHAALLQALRELSRVETSFLSHHQPVHPIHTSGPGLLDLQLDARHLRQAFGVRLADASLAGHDVVHTVDLRQAKSRLQVGESEVEAELCVQEAALGLKAEIAQTSRVFRQAVVVDQEHAAFAGSDQLVGVEAEAARGTKRASASAAILGAVRLRGILDDLQVVALGNLEQRIHVHRVAVDVHRHDRPRPGRDARFDLGDVHRPRQRVAVDHDWPGACQQDWHRARDDGERGQDDLVAGLQVEQADGDLQGHAAVRDRDAVRSTAIVRPTRFEGFDVRPGARDPTRPQRLHHRRVVGFGQQRLIHGDDRGDHAQKRSFSAPPGYGPCLTSSSTVSSRTRKPWPPATAIRMSPARSSRVATTCRSWA